MNDPIVSSVWYISKYVTPPYAAKVGSRGFNILREFAIFGHNVVLITSDSNHLATPPKFYGPILMEVVDGVEVHWLRTLKYGNARSVWRMLSWVHFEWCLWRMPKSHLPRPDILIVSSLSLLTILSGFWLRQKYRCKLIFEVRDIWPMTLTETGHFSRYNPFVTLLSWIERLGYQNADLIVGTMPNLVEHVFNVTGRHLPVVCIPQGFALALKQRSESTSNDYFKPFLNKGKFLVCHSGSIGADNALDTLISCARVMMDRHDIHFLILGDGYLKPQFQQKAADLPNVTFAPGVTKSTVQSVLAHADLLYFAAHKSPLLRFGQSLNKVIDYMLSGKPIVASYTGFPSMINEADCGSFVPAEDTGALRIEIERYAAMPAEERGRIGERGREWLIKNRQFKTLAADYMKHLGI